MNFQTNFQKIGPSTTRIFQFSQPNLDLLYSTIKSNTIQGSFGIAQIVQTRYDPLTIATLSTSSSSLVPVVQYYPDVQRVVITKSAKNRKNNSCCGAVEYEKRDQKEEDRGFEQDDVDVSEKSSQSDSEHKDIEPKPVPKAPQKKHKLIKKIKKQKKLDNRKQIKNILSQLQRQRK